MEFTAHSVSKLKVDIICKWECICYMKHYSDRVPACGVFCGGCPTYIRDKRPCPGAGNGSLQSAELKRKHTKINDE